MAKTAVIGFESRGDTFVMNPDRLTIITDKANPFYEPRAELPLDHPKMVYLIESLKAEAADPKNKNCGNLSDLTIRKNGKDSNGDDVYEVIDGRQRVKAAREINRQYAEMGKEPIFLRCQYKGVTEEKDFLRIMATKNECRIPTPPSMIAIQVDNLIANGGTWKEAERSFAKPEAKLRELVKIARLCEDVHKAVDAGKISVSAATKFEDMTVQAQRTALRELIESGDKITPKQIDEKARTIPCADGGLPPPKVKPPRMKTRREIEARIAEVRCMGIDNSAPIPGWTPTEGLTTGEKAIFISALNWVMGLAPQEE